MRIDVNANRCANVRGRVVMSIPSTFLDVSTFTERVIEAMKAREMGFNELDRAMGKTTAGYTSALLAEEREPRRENLVAMARALGVRLEWLMSGEGVRDDPTPRPRESAPMPRPRAEVVRELDERYPNFAAAATFASRSGTPAAVIERVRRRVHESEADLQPKQWLSLIEAEALQAGFARRHPETAERAEQTSVARDDARADAQAAKFARPKRKGGA
jgi:hypothetical protein